jgi:hypothetical protein
MQGKAYAKPCLKIGVVTGFLFLCSIAARAQEVRSTPSSSPSTYSDAAPELRALADLVRDLKGQVQTLNEQLGDLRAAQAHASEEARELQRELDLVKLQRASPERAPTNAYSVPPPRESSPPASISAAAPAQPQSSEDRISRLEENQEVMEGKINDQYQTKVESGSKYRLRLSGIALLNLFENRGTVDSIDIPETAESQQMNQPHASPGSFGGTLRQSQIRLQAFGPEVFGARTSADVNLDFAGGFPHTNNGAWMGLVRMRTATARLDWTNTSIVAGQDRLFFAPLTPTSLASVAIPALSYAGNLWGWTPQVRIEHRFALSEGSSLNVQGGILDSLSGDFPPDQFERYPSWGEQSGQPAYAVHVSWSRRMFGQDLTVGAGGFYGRQDWGFSRSVDGWAATTDLLLPLGKRVEFSGEFYRGRAVGGLAGGIGQSVLLNGSFIDPNTTFRALDSMGGWAQLKFRIKSNLEINGAFGSDNPFAGELRRYNAHTIYPEVYTRNLSPFVNFIYQIRSDILFSAEYRYLNSSVLDGGSFTANHITLSLGYIF